MLGGVETAANVWRRGGARHFNRKRACHLVNLPSDQTVLTSLAPTSSRFKDMHGLPVVAGSPRPTVRDSKCHPSCYGGRTSVLLADGEMDMSDLTVPSTDEQAEAGHQQRRPEEEEHQRQPQLPQEPLHAGINPPGSPITAGWEMSSSANSTGVHSRITRVQGLLIDGPLPLNNTHATPRRSRQDRPTHAPDR